MPVNANKSGMLLLSVIEQIARLQPIGVRALARDMELEKSAVQRVVRTLAEAGWARPAPGCAGSWELTGRVLHVAQLAHGGNGLRQRARPVLDSLRDRTGETAYMAVSDVNGLVVMEAAESRQTLRLVMPIGTILVAEGSAPGRAMQLGIGHSGRADLAGRQPTEPTSGGAAGLQDYAYVVDDQGQDDAVSIAAPLFDTRGNVVGALAIYAVRARLSTNEVARVGDMLMAQARELSTFGGPDPRLGDPRQAIGSFG